MNRRTVFLIGLLVQLIAIFGLFVPYVLLLKSGTPITLKTVPIDPVSVLRGQYVMLGYEVGNDLPIGMESPVVYAVLKKGTDEFYQRTRFTTEKPTLASGEVCLRGLPQYNRAIFPDIAQFFVQEGLGPEFEQARNVRRLYVDAVVDANCHALIRGLRLGPEVPESELKREDFPGLMRPVAEPPAAKPTKK